MANKPSAASSAKPPTQRFTPRQPTKAPIVAASGTPTSKVSDCPAMTQPSARPRWRSTTRAEASAMSTPVKAPAQAPASVAQTATPKKLCDTAVPTMQRASATGPPTRNGRRPQRSDPAPATSEETPHATEVIAIRLATSGRLVRRSRAMSRGKGARVVPLEDAANMPRQAAASSAQGMRGSAAGRGDGSGRGG